MLQARLILFHQIVAMPTSTHIHALKLVVLPSATIDFSALMYLCHGEVLLGIYVVLTLLQLIEKQLWTEQLGGMPGDEKIRKHKEEKVEEEEG